MSATNIMLPYAALSFECTCAPVLFLAFGMAIYLCLSHSVWPIASLTATLHKSSAKLGTNIGRVWLSTLGTLKDAILSTIRSVNQTEP